MRTIYKYAIPLKWEPFSMWLPEGAHILDAQVQNNEPVLWAMVDPTAAAKEYWFTLVGTGHELPEKFVLAPYLATLQLNQGLLVLHLFGGFHG